MQICQKTHIRVPSHLQVLHRRIRIPRSRESGEVARDELQSLQIIRIAQRVLVAIGEPDVRTVQAEVRQSWVTIGIARSDRTAGEPRSAKVVGIVATSGTVEVVEVCGLEGARHRAGVHGCFVDAAECLVGGNALADVEGVEGKVAAVVEGEETAGDCELGILGGDAQAGLIAFREGADVGRREIGEGCSVVGGCSEHYWNVSGATVAFRDDQLLRVDDAPVLYDVASDSSIILYGLSRDTFEARDLCIDRRLVAAESTEDLLACDRIRLVDGVVRAVCRAIVAIET